MGRTNATTRCKACLHKGKQELNAMLLNGAKHTLIIEKMKAAWPGEPVLNEANISRHWKAHVVTQPITVTTTDPETGLVQQGYLTGHLTRTPEVPLDLLPERSVPIPKALATIINIGTRNILEHPELIGGKELLAAIEMARKLGLFGEDDEEFKSAWQELGKAKKTRKRTRKVTVEETEEETGGEARPQGEEIAGEVVPPAEWTQEELKLLGAPTDD